MFYDEYEYDDYSLNLGDVLSSEEIEEIRAYNEEQETNCGISMDALGLSERDFL